MALSLCFVTSNEPRTASKHIVDLVHVTAEDQPAAIVFVRQQRKFCRLFSLEFYDSIFGSLRQFRKTLVLVFVRHRDDYVCHFSTAVVTTSTVLNALIEYESMLSA